MSLAFRTTAIWSSSPLESAPERPEVISFVISSICIEGMEDDELVDAADEVAILGLCFKAAMAAEKLNLAAILRGSSIRRSAGAFEWNRRERGCGKQ